MPNPVHVNSDRVKFQTKDPVDVRFQEVNIEPGGRSAGITIRAWSSSPSRRAR
jgi:hypothetical protein